MSFLWAILFGAVLGVASGFLSKRRDPGSIVVRGVIGIVGGALAGIVAMIIAPTESSSIWISAIGVIALLFIYWLIVGKRKTT